MIPYKLVHVAGYPLAFVMLDIDHCYDRPVWSSEFARFKDKNGLPVAERRSRNLMAGIQYIADMAVSKGNQAGVGHERALVNGCFPAPNMENKHQLRAQKRHLNVHANSRLILEILQILTLLLQHWPPHRIKNVSCLRRHLLLNPAIAGHGC